MTPTDVNDAEYLESAPSTLVQRLLRRYTDPLGIIDVRYGQNRYTKIVEWLNNRFPMHRHLMLRYGSGNGDPQHPDAMVYHSTLRPIGRLEMFPANNLLPNPIPGKTKASQKINLNEFSSLPVQLGETLNKVTPAMVGQQSPSHNRIGHNPKTLGDPGNLFSKGSVFKQRLPNSPTLDRSESSATGKGIANKGNAVESQRQPAQLFRPKRVVSAMGPTMTLSVSNDKTLVPHKNIDEVKQPSLSVPTGSDVGMKTYVLLTKPEKNTNLGQERPARIIWRVRRATGDAISRIPAAHGDSVEIAKFNDPAKPIPKGLTSKVLNPHNIADKPEPIGFTRPPVNAVPVRPQNPVALGQQDSRPMVSNPVWKKPKIDINEQGKGSPTAMIPMVYRQNRENDVKHLAANQEDLHAVSPETTQGTTVNRRSMTEKKIVPTTETLGLRFSRREWAHLIESLSQVVWKKIMVDLDRRGVRVWR